MPATTPTITRQKRDHVAIFQQYCMEKTLNDRYMIHFSFIDGFLSFFGLTDRRIDRLKEQMYQRRDGENIRRDWLIVGKDLKVSFDKMREDFERK